MLQALTTGFVAAFGAFGGLIAAILSLLFLANAASYIVQWRYAKRRRQMMELEEMAREVVLRYIQSWGQSAAERIEVINAAVAAAGILAVFRQDSDGGNAGWTGETTDVDRAIAFRHEIENIARGEFNNEVDQVMFIIARFRDRRDLEQKRTVQ